MGDFQFFKKLYKSIYEFMGRRSFTKKLRNAISILRHRGLAAFFLSLRGYIISKFKKAKYIPPDSFDNYDEAPMYLAQYEEDQDFSALSSDVKVLAFYLPQFHTFPENDEWWGKGFTEWTNVKKALPRFENHYQPRVPHKDIGYYCLDDIEVMRRQAELAKRHGIYGFCFYYYWFSGKRLMEKPVDALLQHPEIDLPFCLCWANENWTRRWDGLDADILIAQEYSERDNEVFIRDMEKYLRDPRYIRINGKPVIIVYAPHSIPDCKRSFSKWREAARQIGVGEILIWICDTFGHTAQNLGLSKYVDGEVEFPPHNLNGEALNVPEVEDDGAIIYNYPKCVDRKIFEWKTEKTSKVPKHYSCMLAWDNSARRAKGFHAFAKYSLNSFYKWMNEAVRLSQIRLPEEQRYVFINAWNEWGEGTYLEPDEKYGYANINTASRALFSIPPEYRLKIISDRTIEKEQYVYIDDERPRIAVQVHVFFTELLDEIIGELNKIPYKFDLYVSTDGEEKKAAIVSKLSSACKCANAYVEVYPNRGRDVAPFLAQIAPVIEKYDYIGHFHTKKSVATVYGDNWRRFLFSSLIGSEQYVRYIFDLFESDDTLGIIIPDVFSAVKEAALWHGEDKELLDFLHSIGADVVLDEHLVFPAGNMFWARSKAVAPMFKAGLTAGDFPEEKGQLYGTIAHQIERSWVYLAQSRGYRHLTVLNKTDFQS